MAEDIVEPHLPIIDPHHHLYPENHWVEPHRPYLIQDFQQDIEGGHNIISTVYVECSQMFRRTGPEHLRSTGEAEFAAVMGRLSDTGYFGEATICEGFIGRVDLTKGDVLDETLDKLMEASDGRLKGIRFPANWDPDPLINPSTRAYAPEGLMADERFRSGIARLAERGLIFDAWQYFPQLPELADMAKALPEASIVCGHCGGVVGKRAYSGPDNFTNWKKNVEKLAEIPNVFMKLGGLANERTGFGFQGRTPQASEEELIQAWRPFIETCIELFGPERCMFESNFPVDMCATSYRTLWNVYKKIAGGSSADEKASLFSGTARQVYGLK